MKNYDKVEIEIVKLAEYRDVAAASGETEETNPQMCGTCPNETKQEDCLIVS